LISNHEDSFERKFTFTKIEQFLNILAQEIHHKEVKVVLLATPFIDPHSNTNALMEYLHHPVSFEVFYPRKATMDAYS